MVGVVPELTSKSLINIFGRGALGLAGVGVAFQKMGLGDSTPRRSNRVFRDTILSGVVSVKDTVSIHLHDLDGWDLIVLKSVVETKVRAEGNVDIVLKYGSLIRELHERLLVQSADHGWNHFFGWVAKCPRTWRLWLVFTSKEGKK